MEIKNSLLNEPEFKYLKESLIQASEVDHKEEWRIKLIEYLDSVSSNEDDEYFFDSIEFSRFLIPDDHTTAYTDQNMLIWMNAPGVFGENRKYWDFIFCHECLHQLWDTFGVGDKLKNEGIEYNHYILNVASDCVINDYLNISRKKDMPDGLITPQYIKEQFDVIYDRQKDTQYSLYLKLLEKKDEINKDQRCQDQCGGDGQESQGQNQGQSNGQGQGQSDDKSNNKNNQNSKDQDQDQGQGQSDDDNKSQNSSSDNGGNGQDKDNKEDAAKKAQEAADKAKDAAKKAQEAADKAKDAAKKAQEKADQTKENSSKGNGNSQGTGTGSHIISDADLEKIKEKRKSVINKYKERISGSLSEFLSKCKSSTKLEKSGLAVHSEHAAKGWNQIMNSKIKSFIKAQVFKKQRQFKKTYQRVKRGSGVVKMGQPIKPGKKVRNELLTINPAFYIDSSGSMGSGNAIQHVWDATYTICEALKKQFKKEKIVDEITFKLFAFEYDIREIPYGKRSSDGGGTMPFDKLFKEIATTTKDNLINIIITDGESSINSKEVNELLKDTTGLIFFITNHDQPDVKTIAQNNPTKLIYILADSTFSIK